MERLMQYLWQHRLWPQEKLLTTDGLPLRIIDPGRLNTGSGPDFFNAKVIIGSRTWAGDVEIHVKASDWHRHHHDGDPAYDSVVLHVVDRDDASIQRSNGIPQFVMQCSPEFSKSYESLVASAAADLPCASHIPSIPSIHITSWLASLAYERIYDKEERITSLLSRLNGDWESACYVTLARTLGFGINGEPFERLALSLPLSYIGKHRNSLTSVEALLFGQSGLLDSAPADDPYVALLRREYSFLAHKFSLAPPISLGWKMARMRPPMFPQRRIALLAALLCHDSGLMSRLKEVRAVTDLDSIFRIELSPYWQSRYTFGPESSRIAGSVSLSSLRLIAINAVIPLIYAYGNTHDDTALMDRAIDMLHAIPPERNSIVDMFVNAGIPASSAFASQAIIQLRRCYCEPRKCLYCRIGHRLLASKAPR